MLDRVLSVFTYLAATAGRIAGSLLPWGKQPVAPLYPRYDFATVAQAIDASRADVIAKVSERNLLLRQLAARGALESPDQLRICSCGMAVHVDWPDCSVGCLYSSD
jgi:hypothetical protein